MEKKKNNTKLWQYSYNELLNKYEPLYYTIDSRTTIIDRPLADA